MKAASPPAAEYVAVALLRPWAKNPRKNDPAVKAVADSIKRFGFGAPLIARRENGEIIAGHTRLKAAIKLGLAEVPVRYLDLSEAEAHALALADNKVGELAEWDDAALADVLRDLMTADVSMDGLGFTTAEINALIGDTPPPSGADDEGIDYESKYAVLVSCDNEEHQASLFEELAGMGLNVKVLAL
jgi:ParB-like chromosome segregation protein Spo0J